MRYLRIETPESDERDDPGWAVKLLVAVLRTLLPTGNPDLDKLIARARVWWLEIEDTGEPSREIGFDGDGNPIGLGPIGDNCGFLLDAGDDWSDYNSDSAEAAENFERVWESLMPSFAHLEAAR